MSENLKMMAVKIDKKTWSIATACLPAGFASYPYDRVRGCYLIINIPSTHFYKDDDAPTMLVIENQWRTAKDFHDNFKFRGAEKPGEFVPVMRKSCPMSELPHRSGMVRDRVTYNYRSGAVNP